VTEHYFMPWAPHEMERLRVMRDRGDPIALICAHFSHKHTRDEVIEAWHALNYRPTPHVAARRVNEALLDIELRGKNLVTTPQKRRYFDLAC
jgi:hypothetical protein